MQTVIFQVTGSAIFFLHLNLNFDSSQCEFLFQERSPNIAIFHASDLMDCELNKQIPKKGEQTYTII